MEGGAEILVGMEGGELRFGREKGEHVWKYGRWSCCLFLVF